jgi:hypothetical protein
MSQSSAPVQKCSIFSNLCEGFIVTVIETVWGLTQKVMYTYAFRDRDGCGFSAAMACRFYAMTDVPLVIP